MKKLYQEEKWKRYSKIRSASELHRKQLKRQEELEAKARTVALRKPQPYANVVNTKDRITITAPELFDIMNNTDEMLAFFEQVTANAPHRRHVRLNMANVRQLSPDAILYLLLVLDYSRHTYRTVFVSGNAPTDESCRTLLLESGFYDSVTSKTKTPMNGRLTILSVRHDSKVRSDIAGEVTQFCREHLHMERSTQSKGIYATLVECMANTNNHAYSTQFEYSKWWLIALNDKATQSVRFVFLDNGAGIPATIRRDFEEKIREKFANIIGDRFVGWQVRPTDELLIQSALEGTFRTQTGLQHRGKGLPRLKRYADDGILETFVIIANKGRVDVSSDKVSALARTFHGTLLSWEFKNKDV